MKFNLVFTILIASFSLTFFNCSDTPEGSKAHLEAVKKSQEIESLLKTASKQVEEMQEKKDEMLDKITKEQSSEDNQTKEILTFNQSIAKGEGIVENLKTMIAQHEVYIEKHEETALGVAKIQAQHKQINEDYLVAKREITTLEGLYNNLILEHKKIISSN